MFKRKTDLPTTPAAVIPTDRVTSVLGSGISWRGSLFGSGGIRIEGAFEGDLSIRGLIVVGQSGRVTTEKLSANTVIVAGLVQGNIVAERLEIRSGGRVWGDVTVVSFSTEDGAFLRGRVQMEDSVEIDVREAVSEENPMGGNEESALKPPAVIEHTEDETSSLEI